MTRIAVTNERIHKIKCVQKTINQHFVMSVENTFPFLTFFSKNNISKTIRCEKRHKYDPEKANK